MVKEKRSAVFTMMKNQADTDRQITRYPAPFNTDVTPYRQRDFDKIVKEACLTHKTVMAGLKISKAIFLGDVAVGKTCLVNRFCHQVFDANYKATIGVDFEVERFDILHIPFNLQIWDTAGQERFKCIAASYYRGAHAVVLVFDFTNIISLSHCAQWCEDALQVNSNRPLLFLVGTKRDLVCDATYYVLETRALQLAQGLQAEYWAVSSKTGDNVDSLFCRIAALSFSTSICQELEDSDHKKVPSQLILLKNPREKKTDSKIPKCASSCVQ